MKVRHAGGMASLEEAMQSLVEIPDRPALIAYLTEHYGFWSPTDANVTIEYYGFDRRTGWDTHLVCVDGKAALFTDGPLPAPPANLDAATILTIGRLFDMTPANALFAALRRRFPDAPSVQIDLETGLVDIVTAGGHHFGIECNETGFELSILPAGTAPDEHFDEMDPLLARLIDLTGSNSSS
jgi:hypothetical protein